MNLKQKRFKIDLKNNDMGFPFADPDFLIYDYNRLT